MNFYILKNNIMSSGKPSLPILKIFTVENRAYSLNLTDRTITKLG